jgi:undecaprenyl-diphosphatase
MGSGVFLAIIVGMSRVYLGVHYPTDVLAGWCAGALWALGCWLVSQKFISPTRNDAENDIETGRS